MILIQTQLNHLQPPNRLHSTSNFKLIQSNVCTGTLMNGHGHKLSPCRAHYASVFVFLCTHLLLSISSYLHNLFSNISKQALPISRACFIMQNSTARGNNMNPSAARALVCNYKEEHKLHFTRFPKYICLQERQNSEKLFPTLTAYFAIESHVQSNIIYF